MSWRLLLAILEILIVLAAVAANVLASVVAIQYSLGFGFEVLPLINALVILSLAHSDIPENEQRRRY